MFIVLRGLAWLVFLVNIITAVYYAFQGNDTKAWNSVSSALWTMVAFPMIAMLEGHNQRA